MEIVMSQMKLKTVVIATSTFACAALLSFNGSEQRGLSLSIESAQARVGRPLTPVSVAGVARRQYRRGAYGYGAGVVGAGLGAAAIGTAAAVGAATSPWGWGGDPNYAGTGYYAGGPYYGGGYDGVYANRSYVTGRPTLLPRYYGGGAWGAQAAYAAPAAAPAWSLWTAYHANGPWYGYSGWADYKSQGGIVCDPGTLVTGPDGVKYPCQ
jgi:hypothetical protein